MYKDENILNIAASPGLLDLPIPRNRYIIELENIYGDMLPTDRLRLIIYIMSGIMLTNLNYEFDE